MRVCREACGSSEETGIGFVIERKSLNLSEFRFRTAVHVVVGHAATRYNVHHFQTGVDSSSHTRVDQSVGVIAVNQFHGANGSVYLSNPAFHKYKAATVHRADHKVETAFALLLHIGE